MSTASSVLGMKVSYNLANQTGRFPREEQEKGREKNGRAGKSRTYVSVAPPVTIPCIWCLSHGSVSSVLVEWTNINKTLLSKCLSKSAVEMEAISGIMFYFKN